MKFLTLAGRLPALEKKGDQIIAFHRLMHLTKQGHHVEIICFGSESIEEDRLAKQVLEKNGVIVHLIEWRLTVALINVFRAITNSAMPFQCAFFLSRPFQKKISEVVQRLQPDIVYCIMLRIVPNLSIPCRRVVIELVDSMGLNFTRRVDLSRGLKKWLLKVERNRVAKFERNLTSKVERSFVVSSIDADFICSKNIDVIPLGVAIQRPLNERVRSFPPVVSFTGNMNYQPNVDAVLWFVQHCWKEIKKESPGVRLVVAGNEPQLSIKTLSDDDPSIMVTGRVPSIADILNKSTVAVAPMRSGSGMQFKILEAMACGVPVVATTLGLGDISAINGQDIIIADNPNDFARQVVRLIKNADINKNVGNAGMVYVKRNHSWDSANACFEKALDF